MTKQIIIDLAKPYGLELHYQGSTQTMFVHGERAQDFIGDVTLRAIHEKPFPFKLVETKVWPLPIEPTIEKEVEQILTSNLLNTDPIDFGEQTFVNNNVSFAEAAKSSKENLEAKRKLLDQWLISNPIDRTQKGCYNKAAEIFEVSVDYVRDRYRKLRAKKLVENENNVETVSEPNNV